MRGIPPARWTGPINKTLYLLNGIYGSNIDWVSATGVMMWAQERSLAAIMPAGENRFYVDCAASFCISLATWVQVSKVKPALWWHRVLETVLASTLC